MTTIKCIALFIVVSTVGCAGSNSQMLNQAEAKRHSSLTRSISEGKRHQLREGFCRHQRADQRPPRQG